MDIGAPELIIILLIVVLIFGVGRLSKIGGEMGGAIREFRKGLQGESDEKQDRADEAKEPPEVPPTS
jgi:sec-independent protein translocase protein TatA